ncbi:putative trehalose synthase [Tuber indicum]|nr:putative trehalose synthase [Tuber indicum]
MTDNKTIKIVFSIHDQHCSITRCTKKLTLDDNSSWPKLIREKIIQTIIKLSNYNGVKFIGAGIAEDLDEFCAGISPYLWKELDILGVVSKVQTRRWEPFGGAPTSTAEQAESAARACVRCFGHDHSSAITISFRNIVMPDAHGAIKLVDGFGDYESTVRKHTWNTVLKYAYELGGYRGGHTKRDPQRPLVKIAFFSSTPQGSGVALMRHALVRFCSELGAHMSWFVPISSMAFIITKNNQKILQGVANPGVRFGPKKQAVVNKWIRRNAEQYWLTPGGPLAPGGADVVIIDDHHMPALIPLIKKARPEVKIIYRSHIDVSKDLVDFVGSPQYQVWQWIWDFVKVVDVFISHPVDRFVPNNVPLAMVGFMPACIDWLDGLNKPLGERDLRFYYSNLRDLCKEQKVNHLVYPAREYITQIARFDQSKGIPDVIESYRKLCDRLISEYPKILPPQLLICGHGTIHDPDAEMVFEETIQLLKEPRYAAIANDVVVVRIGPCDQMFNAMITKAKVVLQLSLRGGFEVKVSEALHHGKPVVATRVGGIPLQIEHGKSGFLVEVGDTEAVANHLFNLYTDKDLYTKMSQHAKASVSDDVGTVGNAACWLYLAYKLARGEKALQPHARWIMDMAMEEATQEHEIGERILPRKAADFEGKVIP